MQFAFFIPPKNYRFCQKSGNDTNAGAGEWGACSLGHYECVQKRYVILPLLLFLLFNFTLFSQ